MFSGSSITFLVASVLALSATDGEKNVNVLDMYSRDFRGDGTYYGLTTQGTCSYGSTLPPAGADPKIDALVALNAPQFMSSLTCGICLRVIGDGTGLGNDPINGEYIVFVKDLCPECHEGDVDFALNGDGRWKINIQAVQCPVGDTKINYAFQGSNPWYLKLQIRNARIPITSLQFNKNGAWVNPQHSSDGHWVMSDGSEWHVPLKIRMTAANGQVLEDTIPVIENRIIDGNGVQVAYDSSLPSV